LDSKSPHAASEEAATPTGPFEERCVAFQQSFFAKEPMEEELP
jgi:hypothetical protein